MIENTGVRLIYFNVLEDGLIVMSYFYAKNGDFPRKCVTAYNPTRRISNDRQQIKRFSHANGQ